jgi:putative methionine-R-sulfoxide reductase with GAF domain
VSRAEREIAHLALDSSEISAVTAEDDAFLEDLVEDRFMKSPLLRRGE